MPEDQVLRAVLASQVFVVLIVGAALLGRLWHARTWPLRTVAVGLMLVQVYVLAGQAKAVLIGIPFDAFSWVGVIAYSVVLIGCSFAMTHERRGR